MTAAPHLLNALAEISESANEAIVLSLSPRIEGHWVAAIRASVRARGGHVRSHPLFDPLHGEQALEAMGPTPLAALYALDKVCRPFYPPGEDGGGVDIPVVW